MVQVQAAALLGEPQAAPLPGVWRPRCLWSRQKCRLFWFCPACHETSSSRLPFSPGASQRRQSPHSVKLDYETGQEWGEERQAPGELRVQRGGGGTLRPGSCPALAPALWAPRPAPHSAAHPHPPAHPRLHRMRARNSLSGVLVSFRSSRARGPGAPSSGSPRAPRPRRGCVHSVGGLECWQRV